MTIAYTPPLFQLIVTIVALFLIFGLITYLRNRWLAAYWLFHTTRIDSFHNIKLNQNINSDHKKALRDSFRLKMPTPFEIFTLIKPFTLSDYFTAKEVAFFTDKNTTLDNDTPDVKKRFSGSLKFNEPAARHYEACYAPIEKKERTINIQIPPSPYPACNLPIQTLAI